MLINLTKVYMKTKFYRNIMFDYKRFCVICCILWTESNSGTGLYDPIKLIIFRDTTIGITITMGSFVAKHFTSDQLLYIEGIVIIIVYHITAYI